VVWTRLIDTALPTQQVLPDFESAAQYLVTGRSMLVFLAKPKDGDEDLLGDLATALLD
jgi:isoamylase